MIKYRDKDGKVTLVLFDDGTEPEEIEKVRERLEKMGASIEDDTEKSVDLKLSQDDLAWVKGEI